MNTYPKAFRERFESKYIPEPNSGCWLWVGSFSSKRVDGVSIKSYGKIGFRADGVPRTLSAHRVSYELHVGEIPKGLTLDHLCRVLSCVNPDHLEPVSLAENVIRAIAHANPDRNRPERLPRFIRDRCAHGHEFTAENTLWHRKLSGVRAGHVYRACRTCWIDRSRRYRAKRRDLAG